jgi:hypothetical protein
MGGTYTSIPSFTIHPLFIRRTEDAITVLRMFMLCIHSSVVLSLSVMKREGLASANIIGSDSIVERIVC